MVRVNIEQLESRYQKGEAELNCRTRQEQLSADPESKDLLMIA